MRYCSLNKCKSEYPIRSRRDREVPRRTANRGSPIYLIVSTPKIGIPSGPSSVTAVGAASDSIAFFTLRTFFIFLAFLNLAGFFAAFFFFTFFAGALFARFIEPLAILLVWVFFFEFFALRAISVFPSIRSRVPAHQNQDESALLDARQ